MHTNDECCMSLSCIQIHKLTMINSMIYCFLSLRLTDFESRIHRKISGWDREAVGNGNNLGE